MIKLQNNFTTVEQSKRLLELGLPADSADCFYCKDANKSLVNFIRYLLPDDVKYSVRCSNHLMYDYLPCWSVGRLIEILCKCGIHYVDEGNLVFNFKQGRLNDIVSAFVDAIECNCKDGSIDFSKLE